MKKNKLLVEEPIAAWKLSCENDTVIEKLNIQGNRCLKRVTYHNLKEYNKCQVLWRSMCAAVAGRRPARGVRCVPAVINGGLRRPQARVDCLFDLRVISEWTTVGVARGHCVSALVGSRGGGVQGCSW